MQKIKIASGLILSLLFSSIPAFAADDPHNVYGLWRLESGNVDVQVTDCGDGTPCGIMARVASDQPNSPVDRFNKDAELAKRPLIGLLVLSGFERKKSGWKGGKIYNAKNGRTYNSKVRLNDDGSLQVKGCVGPICKTQTWTRVE